MSDVYGKKGLGPALNTRYGTWPYAQSSSVDRIRRDLDTTSPNEYIGQEEKRHLGSVQRLRGLMRALRQADNVHYPDKRYLRALRKIGFKSYPDAFPDENRDVNAVRGLGASGGFTSEEKRHLGAARNIGWSSFAANQMREEKRHLGAARNVGQSSLSEQFSEDKRHLGAARNVGHS